MGHGTVPLTAMSSELQENHSQDQSVVLTSFLLPEGLSLTPLLGWQPICSSGPCPEELVWVRAISPPGLSELL